ncbi:MAG: CoA-acylating methylmalonate-semialdehyde dehydrogenase [Gammaproteobacteria bacterium]|nr:CoA-acylating methylmalonate-semialdehyde dehydrogenase [Gammaproteobacteria bacterium]
MVYTVPHFIGGQHVNPKTNHYKAIYQPATGEHIGQVPIADQALCATAVAAAKDAWPDWANTTPTKRAQILFRFRSLLENNLQDLAQLVTQEHGKTINDAKGSIARGLELIEFHCGLITQLQGTFSANVSTQTDCHSFRQPLGVCAGVSPFNFPIMVPIWMMIPAIACGNTFILKPSEQDPSASLRLLELLDEAGLPKGVVNCIHGDKTTVDHLLAHPDIATFTAVASTPVAAAIYQTATANGKRAHTFGGAKNHAVVMPDADFALTAKALTGAAYGSAGERCMAITVIVAVGDDTATALLAALTPEIASIKIDTGNQPHSDLGPLISQAHRQKVVDAITQGVDEGGKLLIDGRDFVHPKHPQGFFLGPSLFDHVTEDMSIYQNEIFGPVLVMVRVKTFDDALALVNRNQYGNGTAIFTQNGFYARRYSHDVQVGMVGINIPIPVPIVNHPFGGWKQSSFGDTAMHGQESIHFYTKSKTVTTKWLLQRDPSGFVMPENG